jgi:phosphate transport system ATP-binding protein
MSATLLAEDVLSNSNAMIAVKGLNVYYRHQQALKDVTLTVPRTGVTAFIGPSGCGKSTLLRCFNRMNDRIVGFRRTGSIVVDRVDPYSRSVDLLALRRKVGMVFQKPNPFPKSIYENVAIGPRSHYGLRGAALDEAVEGALTHAALWDEVKDVMRSKTGYDLSGGQQQRLCIARMLAVEPDIILMDEPCSALDPISTSKIEDLILELAKSKTVVIVTHNLQQAERVSDNTAFFMYGELIEMLKSREMFSTPKRAATRDYVSGVFG